MLNWLFLDMDCYFASVEQQFQPALRGRPVGVIPVETDHTCCIAASTEAKQYGVKTGTRVKEARQLCPHIQLVKARPKFYIEIHHAIIRSVEHHVPIDKVYSIDEVAIRLLREQKQPKVAAALAEQIKDGLRADIGPFVTCSIGIAPTRLLAKTASDRRKPNGLMILDLPDLPHCFSGMPLNDFPGIGPSMFRRLQQHEVLTVEQLWSLSLSQTRQIWGGVQGEHWWHGLHGNDYPEPATRRRSMGHAHVLGPKWRSEAGAHAIMTRLLHKGAARLRHHGYWAHQLHARIKYESDHVWYDRIGLPACQDTQTILESFSQLWRRRPALPACSDRLKPDRPKKVSITLTGLMPTASHSLLLFQEIERRDRLSQVIDRLNRRWGTHTVYFGGMHDTRHPMEDKIAFGRVPDEAVAM